MNKTFAFVNVVTKKGILQLVIRLENDNLDFINDIDEIESFVLYHERYINRNGNMMIDLDASKFSPTYFIGERIDDIHCRLYDGSIREINKNDRVIYRKQRVLK